MTFSYPAANGCDSLVHVTVQAIAPLQVFLQDAVLDCNQKTAVLAPELLGQSAGSPPTFAWSDGSDGPTLEVSRAGTYTVRISDACHSATHTMKVSYQPDHILRDAFYVPNCFSPNHDGSNDVFQVFPNPAFELHTFEFMVFDRWGDMMFQTTDVSAGWDGVFRGEEKQHEVYVWYVKAQLTLCDGSIGDYFNKGGVTIVR
jgi:gliding motility-associated-like protein